MHLVTHLNPSLHLTYCASKKELNAIEDIETWIHHIILLDFQLATHQKQISTSMAQAAKYAHTNTSNTATTATASTNTSSNPLVAFISIPKLSQPEKDLLDLHQGCYKCRMFYTSHFSHTCTADCPLLDTCKKVTATYAVKAKATFENKSIPVVAAIFSKDMDEEFINEDFVNSDEFNEYISPHPTPPLPEHLWWDCCIDAPLTCAPSPIRALIDHGTSPVLISDNTIELYGLVCRTLFKPFAVSTAFVPGQSIAKPVLLAQYCRLNVSSLDARWKS